MNATLTTKQRLFCLEFIVDLSATRAAIRAGYSKRSAASIGEENLRKPEIRAFLEQARKEREERTKITADQVVQELAAIAFARISDVAKMQDGRVVWRTDVDLKTLGAIQEIVEEETPSGTRKRVRLHDKLRALELLGKNLGMFKPGESRVEHDKPGEIFARVQKAIDFVTRANRDPLT